VSQHFARLTGLAGLPATVIPDCTSRTNAPLYHGYRPTVHFRRPANWISALQIGQEGIAWPVWEIFEIAEEMKRLDPDGWRKALENSK